MLGLVVGHARLAVGDLGDGVREGLGGLAGKVAQVVGDGREGHRAVGSIGHRRGGGHGHAIGGGELELELALRQATALKDLGCREGLGGHGLRPVDVRERGVRGVLQRCCDLAVVGIDKLKLVGGDVLGVRVAAGIAHDLVRRVGDGLGTGAVLVRLDAIEVVLRVAQRGELDGTGRVVGHLLAHLLAILVKELERELPSFEPAALKDLLCGKHNGVVHAGRVAVGERGRQAGDGGMNLASAVIGRHDDHRMGGGVVGHAWVGAGDLPQGVGIGSGCGIGDGIEDNGAVGGIRRLADNVAVCVNQLEGELAGHERGAGEDLLGDNHDAVGL